MFVWSRFLASYGASLARGFFFSGGVRPRPTVSAPPRGGARCSCKGRVQCSAGWVLPATPPPTAVFLSMGVGPPSYLCFQPRASRLRRAGLFTFASKHGKLCAAPPREPARHLYVRPEEASDRENRVFFVLEVQPNLTGLLGAAAQGDAHGRLPASPAPQLAGSPVRPGRGSPSGRGLPRAVASGPTTPERDNPAWFRAWL